MPNLSKIPCKYCDSTEHRPFQCFYKPKTVVKPCKFCKSKLHLSWQCYENPKRIQQIKKKVTNGKAAKQWLSTRREWFKQNQQESYQCHYCGKFLNKNETALDHYHSRSRHPELRYELTNLVPCCGACNVAKGSIDGDDFKERRGL